MDAAERRGTRLAMQRFHHSGTSPIRVLLMGDRTHLLASSDDGTLAERAVDRIWLSTRRGVDGDVLTDLAPVLRAVQGVFRTWRLWRYDVVVIVLRDGLDSPQRPRTLARVGELLEEVLADAAGATDVVVLGPDPVAPAAHGARPAGRLRATVERLASDRVRFHAVLDSAEPEARGRAWAAAIGTEVAASLDRLAASPPATIAEARRLVAEHEPARQHALDELHVVGSARDPRLDDLVELARTAFGTRSAEITFIDRNRRWQTAVAGALPAEDFRAHSFCARELQRAEPIVIGDAMLDPELRTNPLVQGPHGIRFYAAYPIEAVDGSRVGSFCVYDPEPRDVRSLDLAVLRDLVLLAQAEIVGSDAAPTDASPLAPHG